MALTGIGPGRTAPTREPRREHARVRSVPLESLRFAWREDLADEELVELTRAHGGHPSPGWWDRIRPHSLGWVSARGVDGTLIGFTNVAWDACDHAFLLDPKVRSDHQRQGIGTELVRLAA